MTQTSIKFPRGADGELVAQAWLIYIWNPTGWLEKVMEDEGFKPHCHPSLMTVEETKRAIARVLCMPRFQDERGVAVNYRDRADRKQSSVAWLYYAVPTSKYAVLALAHGSHIEPARGTTSGLVAYMEDGGRGFKTIGPVWHHGILLGDNHHLDLNVHPNLQVQVEPPQLPYALPEKTAILVP